MRTSIGTERFCTIRFCLATAEHGLGLMDALTGLTGRQPRLPSMV